MRDRFPAKVWIYYVQAIVFGGLGCFSLPFGILFWTGVMKDADDQARPDSGPPMVIGGVFFLLFAVMALFNIVGRLAPVIRCFREGFECNLVGATALDGLVLIPGYVRVLFAIFSGQGFRSQRVRMVWEDMQGASVSGVPMAYRVRIDGVAANVKTGKTVQTLSFKQVAFVDPPQLVVETLMGYAMNVEAREMLPEWGAG